MALMVPLNCYVDIIFIFVWRVCSHRGLSMSSWTHIVLEAYCMYSWRSEKKHIGYEITDIKTFKKGKKTVISNSHYIPKSKRPKWCVSLNKKRVPQFRCMKCPFFAHTNAEKRDYKLFNKAWRERK